MHFPGTSTVQPGYPGFAEVLRVCPVLGSRPAGSYIPKARQVLTTVSEPAAVTVLAQLTPTRSTTNLSTHPLRERGLGGTPNRLKMGHALTHRTTASVCRPSIAIRNSIYSLRFAFSSPCHALSLSSISRISATLPRIVSRSAVRPGPAVRVHAKCENKVGTSWHELRSSLGTRANAPRAARRRTHVAPTRPRASGWSAPSR